MSIKEKILEQQLSRGVFDYASFAGTEGIAKKAITEGFDSLSPKQRSVLEPYLTKTCVGITDPGGHHNECARVLEEEELLDAYYRCDDTDSLVCDDCNNEEGYYSHQWERISQE